MPFSEREREQDSRDSESRQNTVCGKRETDSMSQKKIRRDRKALFFRERKREFACGK